MKENAIVDSKNLVGGRVRRLRLNRHQTQIETAAKMQLLGIDIASVGICRIESGSRPVTDLELRAFSRIFHVSYAYLIDGEEESTHQKKEG